MNTEDARRTFSDVRVVHVGSVLPTGEAHVVPLWFVWLEDGIYVTSRRHSRVCRNIGRDPRVALQFERGRAWAEAAGVMVHGRAEVLASSHPAARRALSAWFEKYREDLAGSGFAMYSEEVTEPVLLLVQPERLTGWIHAARRRR